MTSRSRQPDRNGLADIAHGSHRQRVEHHVTALLAPARSDLMCALDGARKERAVQLAGRRDRSVLGVRIRTWSVTGAALLVLATGCSDDGEALPGTTTTTRAETTTTTSTPQRPVEEEIVERYEAFWDARFRANQPPPNPDHSDLREYATGRQLEQVIGETTSNLEARLAIRRPSDGQRRSRVEVRSVENDTATLQECAVDDGVIYQYETGAVVNDAVETHNVEAMMRRVDGKWKVEGVRLLQRWEGVAGCAQASDF